jgi:hypothetical protein
MSLHSLERLLFELNRGLVKPDELRDDPDALFANRDLSADERDWLERGDVLALYRHGVHPLLLAPASRIFGLDPQQFRDALAPAVGERKQ